jgi:ubiquinone/menaquinone biosynthesis C-methylase UbiE
MAAERERILAESRRRAEEVSADRYAPWNPAEAMMRDGRRRVAADLLHRRGVFPRAGDPCLEVGCGRLGWLADLLGWGLQAVDLHGIDLDPERLEAARAAFPAADLRVGDATELPWAGDRFKLVIVSTVFSSILDESVRAEVAGEIVRVLAPGGALLWYDFSRDNPANANVRGVRRGEIRRLFEELKGPIRRVTLAPPLARVVAPRSLVLATALEVVPWLRTHLVAVLVKSERESRSG